MRFYFCEGCGKRITEKDIAGGAARDKKLKGVFCQDCAIGVTTLDTLPLSDDEAKELLSEPEAKKPTTARRRKRTTSATRLPSSRRTKLFVDGMPPEQRPRRSPLLWGICIATPLIIVTIIALASGLQKPAPVKEAKAPAGSREEATPHPEQRPAVVTPASDEPKGHDPISEPELPRNETEQSRPPADSEATTATTPPPKSADEPKAKTPAADAKTDQATAPTGEATSPEAKEKPDKPPATGHEAKATSQPVPDLSTLTQPIFAAIRDGNLEGALSLARKIAKPAPKPILSFTNHIEALRDREGAFRAALQKMVGKEMVLVTNKGKTKGKLVAVEEESLKLEKRFVINGEVKGATVSEVQLSHLTPTCRARLFSPAPPTTPGQWMVAALGHLQSGNIDASQGALVHCEKHPLTTPLRKFLEADRNTRQEAKARAIWESLSERAGKRLNRALAERLLKELATYEEEYGSSSYALKPEILKRRQDLKKKLQRFQLGMDPRIARLFRGEITAYNPRTFEIKLRYDCTRFHQLKDMGLNPKKRLGASGWGVRQHAMGVQFNCGGPQDQFMKLPFLVSGDVVIKMRYKFLMKDDKDSARFMAFWFSSNETKGKAQQVTLLLRQKTSLFSKDSRYLVQVGGGLKSVPKALPPEGNLEVACKGQHYQAKVNGQVLLRYEAPGINDHTGIRIGGGYALKYLVHTLEISGRLDPHWLAAALAKPEPTEESGPQETK